MTTKKDCDSTLRIVWEVEKPREKTECCGNWVCGDEGDYVMFSYSRDICSRNHRRFTLCGSHHTEGT